MNLWVSIVVVGTNLISTLDSDVHYMAMFCNIGIAHAILLKCENVCDIDNVGPNIARWQ